MEALAMKVFSEGGLIYLLFFMIVVGFIWKGVPFLVAKFDGMQAVFAKTLQDMHTAHREDMDTISGVFITQIKESNVNHTITHQRLDEIRNLLNNNKRTK